MQSSNFIEHNHDTFRHGGCISIVKISNKDDEVITGLMPRKGILDRFNVHKGGESITASRQKWSHGPFDVMLLVLYWMICSWDIVFETM
jgi:hypothetical protein